MIFGTTRFSVARCGPPLLPPRKQKTPTPQTSAAGFTISSLRPCGDQIVIAGLRFRPVASGPLPMLRMIQLRRLTPRNVTVAREGCQYGNPALRDKKSPSSEEPSTVGPGHGPGDHAPETPISNRSNSSPEARMAWTVTEELVTVTRRKWYAGTHRIAPRSVRKHG